MASFNDDGILSVKAAELLERFRFVKLTAAKEVSYADAGEAPDGVTRNAALADNQVSMIALNKPGTVRVEAAGAIAVNGNVYVANDGKGSATATGSVRGKALEAAGADGDIIEVLLA